MLPVTPSSVTGYVTSVTASYVGRRGNYVLFPFLRNLTFLSIGGYAVTLGRPAAWHPLLGVPAR